MKCDEYKMRKQEANPSGDMPLTNRLYKCVEVTERVTGISGSTSPELL